MARTPRERHFVVAPRMRRTRSLSAVVALASALAADPLARAASDDPRAAANIDWSHYAGDRASTKYSPAAQIDAANVGQLEIAWRWTTPDREIETTAPFGNLKGTPLMVGGVLYAVSSLNLVTALDARTGAALWTYDPKA